MLFWVFGSGALHVDESPLWTRDGTEDEAVVGEVDAGPLFFVSEARKWLEE